jgi:hypothetical protein
MGHVRDAVAMLQYPSGEVKIFTPRGREDFFRSRTAGLDDATVPRHGGPLGQKGGGLTVSSE